MKRAVLPLGALVLAACSIACSLCKSPYDYAGPAVTPTGHPLHGFHDREGSSLVGAGGGGPVMNAGPTAVDDGQYLESPEQPTVAPTEGP